MKPVPAIASSILLVLLAQGARAQTARCNLVANSAMEQGTSTTISNWTLYVGGGAATMSVSAYPQAVQSGARAAKVVVTSPGDIFLTSPEPWTGLALRVEPSTSYQFSARVLAPGSHAWLRVIQWTSTGAVNLDSWLAGASSGLSKWETVQGTILLDAQTHFVSLRLMSQLGVASTTTWDDALVSTAGTPTCVDARHYVAQTSPGLRQCADPGAPVDQVCVDGVKNANKEYVVGRRISRPPSTTWIVDYIAHSLRSQNAISVQKDVLSPAGPFDECFSNPGEPCGNAVASSLGQNVEFGVQWFPLSFLANRVSPPYPPYSPMQDSPTVGASMLHDWQPADRWFATSLGGPFDDYSGRFKTRAWAHIRPTVTFGSGAGALGPQSEVLVYEEEGVADVDTSGFAGGCNLERYFYVRGSGVVKEERWTNAACEAAPSPTTCDGTYPSLLATGTYFKTTAGDLSIPNPQPSNYVLMDWW